MEGGFKVLLLKLLCARELVALFVGVLAPCWVAGKLQPSLQVETLEECQEGLSTGERSIASTGRSHFTVISFGAILFEYGLKM